MADHETKPTEPETEAPVPAAEPHVTSDSEPVARVTAAPDDDAPATGTEPTAAPLPPPVAAEPDVAEKSAGEPAVAPAVPATSTVVPSETTAPPSTPATPAAAATTTDAKPAAAAAPQAPLARLWEAAQTAGHPEVWGVTLADPASHVPSQIVLQKYLNANDGDLAKAKDQLVKTLQWRAKMQPLELVKKVYPKTKFDGLGYVTTYPDAAARPEDKEVLTWNVYGAAKSLEDTFGNTEAFIEWRVALMELAMMELDLSSATTPITAHADPYKLYQVHDYKSISFLRSPPQVRAASSETIRVFAQAYPELLKEKFFVNVPTIMGFMYTFMKLFVAPKTIKKFHPMANGASLAREFADGKVKALGEMLPPEYGGKGKELKAQGKGPLLE